MAKNIVSKKYQLLPNDLNKILIGAAVAAIGAAVTYITDASTTIDWGVWTPAVVAFWSVVANIIRKWISETSYTYK